MTALEVSTGTPDLDIDLEEEGEEERECVVCCRLFDPEDELYHLVGFTKTACGKDILIEGEADLNDVEPTELDSCIGCLNAMKQWPDACPAGGPCIN